MNKQYKFPYWIPVVIGIIFYAIAFFVFENQTDVYISQMSTSIGVGASIIYGKIEDTAYEIKEFIMMQCNKE